LLESVAASPRRIAGYSTFTHTNLAGPQPGYQQCAYRFVPKPL
jgi:hypothetical protein